MNLIELVRYLKGFFLINLRSSWMVRWLLMLFGLGGTLM